MKDNISDVESSSAYRKIQTTSKTREFELDDVKFSCNKLHKR